jgi:NDP-sugar pyrophosphorylase family protein
MLEMLKNRKMSWSYYIYPTKKASEDAFCFTYGDGLSNVNITEQIKFHRSHGKLATITAVQPPGRYGALEISETNSVKGFLEKPKGEGGFINGGYFVLSPKCIDFITVTPSFVILGSPPSYSNATFRPPGPRVF